MSEGSVVQDAVTHGNKSLMHLVGHRHVHAQLSSSLSGNGLFIRQKELCSKGVCLVPVYELFEVHCAICSKPCLLRHTQGQNLAAMEHFLRKQLQLLYTQRSALLTVVLVKKLTKLSNSIDLHVQRLCKPSIPGIPPQFLAHMILKLHSWSVINQGLQHVLPHLRLLEILVQLLQNSQRCLCADAALSAGFHITLVHVYSASINGEVR
mmetsp:Transcript_28190/g.65162  ORF Transcript_28190/g.65162 Transcript_28190/m.65162 type:complete len:208 (-) Transcript_28190:643-1266(-)